MSGLMFKTMVLVLALFSGGLASAAETPMAEALSENGLYKVLLFPAVEPLTVNNIQRWKIKIETASGDAVENATFNFDARMPEHKHGMPTVPKTENYFGDGYYTVSGIKFSMPGYWQIKIDGSVGTNSLYAVFDLQI